MTVLKEKRDIFKHEVLGLRELRTKISEVFSRVTNNFEEIITGNVKKEKSRTASLIATETLKELLDSYKFNPTITKDKTTGVWEISIDEISAAGFGDTKEKAVEMIVDVVLDLTDDFFEEIDLNMRIENTRRQYPFYLRIKHCSSINELLKVLNLNNII